ncbi:hypothetical protein FXO38_17985 [Capsicum annuum]|nr:hypothetical protein FXO38_17985 [Capsicum annuum]KAF3651467.1 hypothetical protein FXO37_17987 [Capsicum annuum]
MPDAQRVQESCLPWKKNAYGTFYEFNNRKFESDPCRRQEARRLGLKSVVGVKIGTSSSAIEEKINEIVESLTSNLEESLNGTIQVGPSKALSINAVILKANKKEAQQQWLGMVLDTGSQRSDPLSTGKKSWEWLDTMPSEKVTFLPEGISDHCPAKLTYLIFADDLMVFCKGKEGSIIKIKESLAHFNAVTELVVNMKKSNIFLALMEDNVKAQLMSLTGFSQDSKCRLFLWENTDGKRKVPLVAWNKVCVPQKYGGLGIKEYGMWNMASVGGLLTFNFITLFFRRVPDLQFYHPLLQAGS